VSQFSIANVSDKVASSYVNKVGLDLLCSTNVNGPKFQIKMFERLLALPVLQFAMPDYVVRHKELLQCEVVCNSLSTAWKGLKYGVGKDQYVAQNVVKVVVVSTSSLYGLKAARTHVGFNRRSLTRALHQMQLLDAK